MRINQTRKPSLFYPDNGEWTDMSAKIARRAKPSYLTLLLILALPILAFVGCNKAPTYFEVAHTYIALGESFTAGAGATNPAKNGYVALVGQHLTNKSTRVYNYGIRGANITGVTNLELPRAVEHSPDLITVWAAIDDFTSHKSLTTYTRDLALLLDSLGALNHGNSAQIYVGNIPKLIYLPRYRNLSSAQKAQMLVEIQRWNAAIAAITKQHKYTLVDFYDKLDLQHHATRWTSSNGLDPNNAGYQAIANIWVQAIANYNHV
jgi:lysophospholipase L1-like esterase